MTVEKAEAVGEFLRQTEFERACYVILRTILAKEPLAVMFVYELPDGTVALTTAPFSVQLARGLSDAAYELMWNEKEREEIDAGDN